MKKRLIAILTLLCLCVGLLAACDDSKIITQEKAKEIALQDAGLKEKDVEDIHIHVVEDSSTPYYNIHFTVNGTSISYNISATGEILSAGEGGH